MYSAAFYVISSAISMKMGYWTMTYLQVFQGQRSTLKKISPKRGPQRKYDNYCPLLTAAMRLEKRDYAMLLLAILLGMRAGDICALKFKNLDWHQKLITYTQQKTQKVNTLPLLPVIGDAIIDYLKNGRLDSDCDNVFIRHIHPYGEFQSSTTLSENLKRYMKYAGMTVKKRKAAHSLRHTLASSLLYDGTPLMTISNILGHNSPKTTSVYTKVDLPALRKCALSYGERRELI